MAAPYVTGAEILTAVGVASPTAADTAWAGVCATAIEAALAKRLEDVTASADLESELQRAAVIDGAAAYLERKAPHGVLSVGPDGDVARLGAQVLRACASVLDRHVRIGIA